MKQLLTLLCLCSILASCKTETKEQSNQTETISEVKQELTIAEKIAKAHGYDHWNAIGRIDFTFNVDRGENHFERKWIWEPKKNQVAFSTGGDSIVVFNRNKIDSTTIELDQKFINDKYWLLVPFQLIWDKGTTISNPVKDLAPISKKELHKIVLTYGNEGGYTPGDAYDIFYDDDFIIREWVFREGNRKEPSMATTFENYQDFNGLKIAKDHKMTDGNFNLYFSNVNVQ
ncbi:hypothetical protein [uncultured Psychroserpens sp.]|uniref:hypothetical protein n=1 Tax=uncultured Psychroserpens sp. TaxID=255436 RepID=UPI002629204E|nr:hypothetical protein [uncultured Psychroserpens sp.]